MELPIPTDNLYKFLALAGVALVVLGYVVPHDKINDIERRIAEADAQRLIFTAELHALDKDTSLAKQLKTVPPEQLKDLTGRLLDVQRKFAQIDGADLQVNVMKKQLEREQALFRQLVRLGSMLSLSGFVLWYVLVQRPTDLVNKSQGAAAFQQLLRTKTNTDTTAPKAKTEDGHA